MISLAKSLNILKQQMPRLTRTQNCPMLMVRVELLCLLLPLCTKVLLRLLEAFLSSECCSCCYFTLLINIKQSSAVYCHDESTESPISIFGVVVNLVLSIFKDFELLYSSVDFLFHSKNCTVLFEIPKNFQILMSPIPHFKPNPHLLSNQIL